MSALHDWTSIYSGKVRELYIPKSASNRKAAEKLLIVATDRVSAFDHILSPELPGKGNLLVALTRWWLEQLDDIPNHLLPEEPPVELASRAMVVLNLDMFPVECVVRGYLAGSGWREYQASSSVCGIPLPNGLSEGDQLPEPLFTPATKADLGDHDENISFDTMIELLGHTDALQLKELSLDIYQRARDIAHSRGLILADTKFEFGRNRATGTITLGDEVLTSDSSRYWDGEIYSAGGIDRLDSFDKQLIRNWLREEWDMTGVPPSLPQELIDLTLDRYQQLSKRLTGKAAAAG
jgi:phosphoribosylaminoimidazole-succinocarboxamide synthase